jgi:hypothetical protein|tara:strand:- start:1195 stop:1368 length:174 start_codon:yes stop_codon:yes gene_type:complete
MVKRFFDLIAAVFNNTFSDKKVNQINTSKGIAVLVHIRVLEEVLIGGREFGEVSQYP